MKKKIDDKGRLVIPKEMRNQLKINKCDPVNIECTGDNKIILTNLSEVDYKAALEEIEKFCKSNEWVKHYENRSCRTHILEIINKVKENK